MGKSAGFYVHVDCSYGHFNHVTVGLSITALMEGRSYFACGSGQSAKRSLVWWMASPHFDVMDNARDAVRSQALHRKYVANVAIRGNGAQCSSRRVSGTATAGPR